MERYIEPRDVASMMDARYALFGLFFAFHNRLQAVGDSFYKEITCKQFFLLACMYLFKEEAPTPMQLAHIMGSSHQNVKQMLTKLEQKGFVRLETDPTDRRKLRIYTTDYALKINSQYQDLETQFMNQLFDGITPDEAKETLDVMAKIEENLIKIKERSST